MTYHLHMIEARTFCALVGVNAPCSVARGGVGAWYCPGPIRLLGVATVTPHVSLRRGIVVGVDAVRVHGTLRVPAGWAVHIHIFGVALEADATFGWHEHTLVAVGVVVWVQAVGVGLAPLVADLVFGRIVALEKRHRLS